MTRIPLVGAMPRLSWAVQGRLMTAVLALVLVVWPLMWPAGAAETISYENFGAVEVVRPATAVTHVVILLSSASGPGPREAIAARRMADKGALVLVVHSGRYLRTVEKDDDECPNVSLHLEELSKFAQQTLGLTRLHTPLLVGVGEGATMVYANLVQAPPETFLGGVSISFRPDMQLSKPFCQGKGLKWSVRPDGSGLTFLRQDAFNLSWVVLKPTRSQAFGGRAFRTFVHDIPGARVITLPALDDTLAIEGLWGPQLDEAISLLRAKAAATALHLPAQLANLPLTEVKTEGPALTDSLAIFISGDGGWAGLDRDLANYLAERGLPVIGVDSLRYFWQPKEPEAGGADLARIIRYYLKAWGRDKVILMGYSLGAEALPSMAANLPEDLRVRLRLVTLLAPGRTVDLAFNLTDWVGGAQEDKPLKPEVLRLKPTPVLCLWGQEELPEDSLCPLLGQEDATVVALPGSHHFDGRFDTLGDVILQKAGLSK